MITPRFLAEEHTETVEDPTTSESGSGLEREALGDATIRTSVFSSLSFNLLYVIQDFTSFTHSWIEKVREVTSEGLHDFWS